MSKVVRLLNGKTTPEISYKWLHRSFASSGKLFIGGRSDSVANNFEGRIDELRNCDTFCCLWREV